MSEEPVGQITTNCHYISRFLTRPWETEDGQRQLHYFDFDTQTFGKRSSRSLFAKDEINSQAVEEWLNDFVENPLGRVRDKLASGDPKALNDWPFFRAAVLMLWLQGVRSKSVEDRDLRRDLTDLASKPESHIDILVNMIRSDYDLQLVFTTSMPGDNWAPLSVPSTGVFPFALPDAGNMSHYTIAMGMPVDPTCALVATPIEKHGKLDLSLLPKQLANLSVGTKPARRVVLYPPVVASISEDQLRRDFHELRERNEMLVTSAEKIRELVLKMMDVVGIQPGMDRAGRIAPLR